MKINELDKLEPQFILDASWHFCPVPILWTEKEIQDMPKGQILKLIFTDPGAQPDLQAWCKVTGNKLLGFKEDKPKYAAFIQKT